MARREAQPSRGGALQGRGNERRLRAAGARALGDVRHAESRAGQHLDCAARVGLQEHTSFAVGAKLAGIGIKVGRGRQVLTIKAEEAGFERCVGAVGRPERGGGDAEGSGNEGHALAFALHDQPQRGRLHPAGRQSAADFLPKHGRDEVPDQAVQHAPRFLRLHQPLIDLAGIRQGLRDG